MVEKSWIILFFSTFILNANSDGLQYMDIIENFETLKLLNGLQNLGSDSSCATDIAEYLNGIYTGKRWALTMFDSCAKVPDGLLTGNTKFMGHYDECIGVEHPNNTFIGQHCMLKVTVTLQRGNTEKTYVLNPLLEKQEIKVGLTGYGICVPSTCSAFEIAYGLKNLFNASNLGDLISVSVDSKNCQTKNQPELQSTDWAAIGIFIAFGVLALLSTIYDMYQRFSLKNAKPHQLLSSFSIYSNGVSLFRISQSSAQLKALHGLRVLSMCWVVLGHAYSMVTSGPPVNSTDLLLMVKDANYVLIFNALVSVDSFFFLSGLLVCFVFFRDISKNGYYDAPLGYIHRYLRLTPPYATMILVMATVFIYMGDGPSWHELNDAFTEPCRKDWWTGLLYVGNFVSHDTCLGQSWYLSADMQMYWISPFILFPMYFWPKFAPAYLGLLILGSAFTTFAVAYVNELGASLFFTQEIDLQGTLDYVPFYTRLSPWLIGVATGYLICGIQAKKIKIELSKFWIMIGWLTSTGLCLGSLYGIMPFTDLEYTTLEASFYLAFHRVAWGLGLAWITFACVQGYGGPVNTFLSWDVFQPLGKLSYSVYLLHASVQLHRTGILRTSTYFSNLEAVYLFLASLVLSNLIAIPFMLIFEMPFGNIDRYLFQNVKIFPLPWPKKRREEITETTKSLENTEQGNSNKGFQREES